MELQMSSIYVTRLQVYLFKQVKRLSLDGLTTSNWLFTYKSNLSLKQQ